jgi:O-acetylserine/cysteine efflux transporter
VLDEPIGSEKLFALALTIMGIALFINAQRVADCIMANAIRYKK